MRACVLRDTIKGTRLYVAFSLQVLPLQKMRDLQRKQWFCPMQELKDSSLTSSEQCSDEIRVTEIHLKTAAK
jgi:hypothetical protein